jgi:hypothetical protein
MIRYQILKSPDTDEPLAVIRCDMPSLALGLAKRALEENGFASKAFCAPDFVISASTL